LRTTIRQFQTIFFNYVWYHVYLRQFCIVIDQYCDFWQKTNWPNDIL